MSRARILADYVSSGDELADKAPLASPAFTGTPTGITAAHLEAGVLPSDVTGGSGLTALGTVTAGNISHADIVYPAGHVLQVLSVEKVNTHAHTSTSFTPVTGLSRAITPHRSGSKIMVIASVVLGSHNLFGTYGGMRITANVDGGSYSAINVGNPQDTRSQVAGWIQGHTLSDVEYVASNFLHAPTYDLGEELIYRVETNAQAGSYYVMVNRSGQDANEAYHARGASNITVMEVAQ